MSMTQNELIHCMNSNKPFYIVKNVGVWQVFAKSVGKDSVFFDCRSDEPQENRDFENCYYSNEKAYEAREKCAFDGWYSLNKLCTVRGTRVETHRVLEWLKKNKEQVFMFLETKG